ncbi:hypothetical protein [Halonotius sp. GCM10025705]|uniref:hypothetical protein n=1 Tax=Halonotius sp. GCM10025705 TaxID=3252678 RepID=UPI00361C8B39
MDEKELRRQAHIVQYYVDNDRYWIAIECARELMINRFLYDAGLTEDWLEHDNRARIAPARETSTSNSPMMWMLFRLYGIKSEKLAISMPTPGSRLMDVRMWTISINGLRSYAIVLMTMNFGMINKM